MRKIELLFACIILIEGLLSCKEDLMWQDDIFKNDDYQQYNLTKLEFDTDSLAFDEINIVANLFDIQRTKSRSSAREVRSIIPISDEKGNIVIYAVNYDDGYILVSATTSYFPILAEVAHGEFSLEDSTWNGQSIIISELIEKIHCGLDNNQKQVCKSMWAKYKKDLTYEIADKSRGYDDINAALDALVANYDMIFSSQLYRLNSHECRELLPEDVYEEFCNVAASEDFWYGTPYSWENTAMVIVTHHSNDGYIGPFLTTHWHQQSPYNAGCNLKLGCVTVAIGQMMKYYKKPNWYSWDMMPDVLLNAEQSPELVEFLTQLRTVLNGDPITGGSNPFDAIETFKHYGYSVSFISHNVKKITESLKAHCPVMAIGLDNVLPGGHAWVIDGYRDAYGDDEYVLYRLSDAAYPEFEYALTEPDMRWGTPTIPLPTFHMNWGWGGDSDGWYVDPDVKPVGTDYNLSVDRTEIIINN